MVRRPDSIPNARGVMMAALAILNGRGEYTPCADESAIYADSRDQTPADAVTLCADCPLILECRGLGFTESVHADNMIYGGLVFKKGKPLVPESKNRVRKPRYE